jgi:hypothetical protein
MVLTQKPEKKQLLGRSMHWSEGILTTILKKQEKRV